VALLKRLETDRSLAVFAGQFVPLKLVTDGNPEWSKWARQYPVEGNGIPRLYVIRADGERIYSRVGSLGGDALHLMLRTTLQSSGRSFNAAETALLMTSVEAAEKAMAAGNSGEAAAELSKLAKVGTVGDLKSYSALALKADEIARKLVEASDSMMNDAVADLENVQTAFKGALVLAEAERQYVGFGKIRTKVLTSIKAAKRNKEIKPYMVQAEALTRARGLVKSEKATDRNKAPRAYENVIRGYPGTEADKLARQELTSISPDAKILHVTELPTKPKLRTWTDISGKFKVRGTFVKLESGNVTLKKESGDEVTLPLAKLSISDQSFLRRQEK